ncbi:MAG: hypothetical protein ACFFA6_16800 [Promethearchaeota archaeon]
MLRCRAATATIPGNYRLLPESSCLRPPGSAAGSPGLPPAARFEPGQEHS